MRKVKVFHFFKYRLYKKNRMSTPSDFQCAHLSIRRSRSNIFLTLTDKYYKVITCQTSGTSIASSRKKRKISPHSIEKIVSRMNKYFIHYKINGIQLRLHIKPSVHSFLLLRELSNIGIFIDTVKDCRRLPFSFMRKCRQKRI